MGADGLRQRVKSYPSYQVQSGAYENVVVALLGIIFHSSSISGSPNEFEIQQTTKFLMTNLVGTSYVIKTEELEYIIKSIESTQLVMISKNIPTS